jgi:hypothetical protein
MFASGMRRGRHEMDWTEALSSTPDATAEDRTAPAGARNG